MIANIRYSKNQDGCPSGSKIYEMRLSAGNDKEKGFLPLAEDIDGATTES
ncbi:MAG: hypothetical protein P0107_03455 [Nitrosomonas sp.]|nr:hypothetical protein [Nitrosomonas sp.]